MVTIETKIDVPQLHDGMAAIMIFGIGFAPITALALSLMGISTLPFALSKQLLTRHQQARITRHATKQIGLGFGIFVWACLMVTLKISPQGEDMMFVLTPTSLLLSLIGHLVFGYTLGCLVSLDKSR